MCVCACVCVNAKFTIIKRANKITLHGVLEFRIFIHLHNSFKGFGV